MHIYRILNTINGKSYIGLDSSSSHRRWTQHRADYKKPDQYEKPLYRAMRKYGVENFAYEVLEECEFDLLPLREQHWIAALDSTIHGNGYNLTRGGETSSYEFLSEETKARIVERMTAVTRERWNGMSEEDRSKALQQTAEAAKKGNDARSKQWIVISPEGERQVIKSLRGFSLQHGLQPALMHLVATGRQTHHKGWKVEPIDGPSIQKTKFTRRSNWILRSPDGIKHSVSDLRSFCEAQGLLYKQMHKVTKGIRSHHRGWTMEDTYDDTLQETGDNY
jgi:group I intron endonuclease